MHCSCSHAKCLNTTSSMRLQHLSNLSRYQVNNLDVQNLSCHTLSLDSEPGAAYLEPSLPSAQAYKLHVLL